MVNVRATQQVEKTDFRVSAPAAQGDSAAQRKLAIV
jgi:hypothetical protein